MIFDIGVATVIGKFLPFYDLPLVTCLCHQELRLFGSPEIMENAYRMFGINYSRYLFHSDLRSLDKSIEICNRDPEMAYYCAKNSGRYSKFVEGIEKDIFYADMALYDMISGDGIVERLQKASQNVTPEYILNSGKNMNELIRFLFNRQYDLFVKFEKELSDVILYKIYKSKATNIVPDSLLRERVFYKYMNCDMHFTDQQKMVMIEFVRENPGVIDVYNAYYDDCIMEIYKEFGFGYGSYNKDSSLEERVALIKSMDVRILNHYVWYILDNCRYQEEFLTKLDNDEFEPDKLDMILDALIQNDPGNMSMVRPKMTYDYMLKYIHVDEKKDMYELYVPDFVETVLNFPEEYEITMGDYISLYGMIHLEKIPKDFPRWARIKIMRHQMNTKIDN